MVALEGTATKWTMRGADAGLWVVSHVLIRSKNVRTIRAQTSGWVATRWQESPGNNSSVESGIVCCQVFTESTLPSPVVGSVDWPNQQVTMQNSAGAVDFSLFTEPATTVDVTTVNIHAEATPGASVSTVPLVDAPPSHGPPPGYRVTGITITPVSVTISGDPAAVGRVQRITLGPVDLSRSTSDATFQIPIDYQSLNVTGTVGVATVRYTISPNPNVSPTAAPT